MAPPIMDDERSRELFKRLKGPCVPLMGNSLLIPASTGTVAGHLADLLRILKEAQETGHILKPSVVDYILTPLMAILRRNTEAAIPDQLLERILAVLTIVNRSWWWSCQPREWEQLFMLCGSILGGVTPNGKEKARDEETRTAAACALESLLYPLSPRTADQKNSNAQFAARMSVFRSHAQTDKFMSILGQTFDWVLSSVASANILLQLACLDVVDILSEHYLPDDLIPSVLPGVASTMSKTALGISSIKGWAPGESIRVALHVMEVFIVRAVGDDICFRQGAFRRIDKLEDLGQDSFDDRHQQTEKTARPYATARTASWLNATSSQLHMTLNTLTSLTSHPNPTALRALSHFSHSVLMNTANTLPSSQPLLISFLLSLSMSPYERVEYDAQTALRRLLSPTGPAHRALLQALAQLMHDHLSLLPRLLTSGSDAKVKHSAKLIQAGCQLTSNLSTSDFEDHAPPVSAVGHTVGKLLGPTGGIEKWGWNLLSTLEFSPPAVTVTSTSAAQITLEHDPEGHERVRFPSLELRSTTLNDTQTALANMLRALGSAAGQHCLFAVEWFVGVSQGQRSARAASALWCAARLLEGACRFTLDGEEPSTTVNSYFIRAARSMARAITDAWEAFDDDDPADRSEADEGVGAAGDQIIHEHVAGLVSIRAPHEARGRAQPQSNQARPKADHSLVHRALSLQLLAVISGILQHRFTQLLLYTIYPILHSIVSNTSFLSHMGLATLQYIARNVSYASPANLLLSNFDYALDAVARHLTRRLLDMDASRALVLLVRLVGKDVVSKAGDVVEACFDRLDEFHGYEVVVDGLIDVLNEVVMAVDPDDDKSAKHTKDNQQPGSFIPAADAARFRELFDWFCHRTEVPATDNADYGPAPREAWTNNAEPNVSAEDVTAATGVKTDEEPSFTATQVLTKQIVSRSMFFLTHYSPSIRARILTLLTSSVAVLPASAMMPSVHRIWPFVLNRLADPEPFVVSAAAALIEALVVHDGVFMFRRIWDDVWPRFRTLLHGLDATDHKAGLVKWSPDAARLGTESAYTSSHRLYRALLRTMALIARHVQTQDSSTWEVLVMARRFLDIHTHTELQKYARELYISFGRVNEDAVWLALWATTSTLDGSMSFLSASRWDVQANVDIIMTHLEST